MRYALAVLLILALGAPAQADCIARSLNILAVVQTADVLTTNGPVTRTFPGGFLTQNNAAGCGLPGAAACKYTEGDHLASRAGCVKSLGTDAACAITVNFALREAEYLALHGGTDAARKDVCFVNYLGAIFYAGIVIPNNLRTIYDIKRNGAFIRNPNVQFTFRRWNF